MFYSLKKESMDYAGLGETKVLMIIIRWIGFDTYVPVKPQPQVSKKQDRKNSADPNSSKAASTLPQRTGQ